MRWSLLTTLGLYLAAGSLGAQVPVWHRGADANAWHVVHDVAPTLGARTTDVKASLAVARAELLLGRPERAQQIVAAIAESFDSTNLEAMSLLAVIEYAMGDHAVAGRRFALSAALAEGEQRGILHARAAEAYEQAGYRRLAAAHYAGAAKDLTAITGWLALRQARSTVDVPAAFKLLLRVTPAARRLAATTRAQVYVTAADTVKAIQAFAAAAAPLRAGQLALASADSTTALRFLYQAAESADSASRAEALHLIERGFPPGSSAEFLRLARLFRRRDAQRALGYARRSVQLGDSTAGTLRFLGDLERSAGNRRAALQIYHIADGKGSATAAYRRARLLGQVGRARESHTALAAFADRYPHSPAAPVALFLVADALRRAERWSRADSLFREVALRWPRSQYAGRSRLQLASMAISRGDTATALKWYTREIGVAGSQRKAARFLLAQLRNASGDTSGALAHWARLARQDSLGYYGTVARQAAGLSPPTFVRAERITTHEGVQRVLEELDLLRATNLAEEEAEFVAFLVARRGVAWTELVAIADGLVDRGWVWEGVTLGWRAADLHTLNDTRVLRVIFPWPMRALIEREAREHNLDPYLVAGLIRQESAFRPAVTSRAGAKGLMQLMPRTARQIARGMGVEWEEAWLTIADANLHLGAAHLAGLLKQYGDVGPALAAYNAGGRPVARWLKLPEADDPYRFVERIPYAETRGYVRTVLRNQALYRALYPPFTETSAATP